MQQQQHSGNSLHHAQAQQFTRPQIRLTVCPNQPHHYVATCARQSIIPILQSMRILKHPSSAQTSQE